MWSTAAIENGVCPHLGCSSALARHEFFGLFSLGIPKGPCLC